MNYFKAIAYTTANYQKQLQTELEAYYRNRSIFIEIIVFAAVCAALAAIVYFSSIQSPVKKANAAIVPKIAPHRLSITKYFYVSHYVCAPNAKCITASGRKAQAGITVACSRNYPLGTKIIIANKTYRCDDRLDKKFDYRLDEYEGNSIEAYQRAKRLGVQYLPVQMALEPSAK